MVHGRLAIAGLGDACCGCGACSAACSAGCISMAPDACGFLRPFIDASACVGCGACDGACPALGVPGGDGCLSAMWAKASDAELLDRSSSGGVFGLLARDALARGGAVAGAAWGDGCRELRHVVAEGPSGLDAVMRSKYVQSSVGREVYEGVRAALRTGRPVLFCGTACQVAAMRSYLGDLADGECFLGVEVICHGVPSPELWRRWLGYLEARGGGEVRAVNFRSKATGWESYSVAYELASTGGGVSVRSVPHGDDWYMRAFLANASLRVSCLSCPFKRRCGSDLTLGDYWGIRRQHPEVPVEGGVSAVVANTERGAAAIGRIRGSMAFGESSLEKVLAGNPSLARPAAPHVDRERFLDAVASGTPIPDMMARWSFSPTAIQRVKSSIKRAIKAVLRRP